MILNKGDKIIQCGKNSFFQQTTLGQLDIHMQKSEVWTPTLHPKEKWTKGLNIKAKLLKHKCKSS